MADEANTVPLVVDGRTLAVRRPDPEQVLAWMGLAGYLAQDLGDRPQAEISEDVSLILEAILGLFESDEDRRWFRRATVLGKARISDVLSGLVTDAEESTKPVVKPKVRRAGGR
jgi:hypothetical protein